MKYVLSIFIFLAAGKVMAQQETFLMLNKDQEETDNEKRAKFYVRIKKVNDTAWRKDLYNMYGPLINITYYKNRALSAQHGPTYLYDATGTLTEMVMYHNGIKTGEVKKYDTSRNHGQFAGAEFVGGIAAWHQYLNKNLRYPQRAIDRWKMGTVTVQFLVTPEGAIVDPIIFQSVEYSLDQETLRIMLKSPNWIPPSKDGKPILAPHRQPITFKLEKG